MSSSHLLVGAAAPAQIEIKRMTPRDVLQALGQGLDDFAAMPSHAVFLCVVYPLIGLFLIAVVSGNALLPLAFPIAAGFALVGPFAAIGLYELSRRREAGLDTTSSHAFDVLHSRSIGAIVALGILLMLIFLVWVAVADAIYVANFGYNAPASVSKFVSDVFTTPRRLERDRRRHRCWLCVRPGGADDQRNLIPLVARSRRRCRCRSAHIDSRSARQPGCDGFLGPDRCLPAGRRLTALLSRTDCRHAGARPCDLASLSQGGRIRRHAKGCASNR